MSQPDRKGTGARGTPLPSVRRPTVWRRVLGTPFRAGIAALATLGVLVGLATASGVHMFTGGTPPADGYSAAGPAGSTTEFAYLFAQHSNYCSLAQSTVEGYPDSARLQGACCNALNQAKYEHQVSELRQYQAIADVPPDPYDIRASLAKALFRADAMITLSPSEQAVFDSAMTMTADHAPCCCQCWRWFAIRGLDKVLITRYHLDAPTVARLTDLVNGCGGPLAEGRLPDQGRGT